MVESSKTLDGRLQRANNALKAWPFKKPTMPKLLVENWDVRSTVRSRIPCVLRQSLFASRRVACAFGDLIVFLSSLCSHMQRMGLCNWHREGCASCAGGCATCTG